MSQRVSRREVLKRFGSAGTGVLHTGEKADGPLTLQLYPGANGSFTLYEDDGITFDYRKGEWMKIELAWNDRRRRLTMGLAPGSRMLPPLRRNIELRVSPEKTSRARETGAHNFSMLQVFPVLTVATY